MQNHRQADLHNLVNGGIHIWTNPASSLFNSASALIQLSHQVAVKSSAIAGKSLINEVFVVILSIVTCCPPNTGPALVDSLLAKRLRRVVLNPTL